MSEKSERLVQELEALVKGTFPDADDAQVIRLVAVFLARVVEHMQGPPGPPGPPGPMGMSAR